MVVVTITTVGFRAVDPLRPAGTILTILIVIFGVAAELNLLAIGAEYVTAVKREGEDMTVMPDGGLRVRAGDDLFVVSSPRQPTEIAGAASYGPA